MPAAEGSTHPLLGGEQFISIWNWHAWLKLWASEMAREGGVHPELLLGLLHYGFAVHCRGYAKWDEPKYDEEDRVIFYLRVADGYDDYDALGLPNDRSNDIDTPWGRRNQSGMRKVIARKAYDMLCVNVLRSDWKCLVTREKLLPEVMRFFRVEDRGFGLGKFMPNGLRNITPTQNDSITRKFLLDLALLGWGFGRDGSDADRAIEERLIAHRPQFLEILYCLRALNTIPAVTQLELDENCLAKLEQLAMLAEFPECSGLTLKRRQVRTVEESALLENGAAQLLVLIRAKTQERKRLKTILEAERAKQEAERRLAELAGEK